MRIAVDRRVLIPRPETETLVERSLSFLRERGEDRLDVLDVGAGSGNIAVAIARFHPGVRITAVDVSAEALAGFRQVLERCGREGPITPAAVRDATGLSRKHLIPLLEWADRAGVTIRRDDARALLVQPA